MQPISTRFIHVIVQAFTAAAIIMTACAPSIGESAPTINADVVFTAAHHTFAAAAVTELALTPPTNTPAPTTAVTASPGSTRPAGGQGVCDGAVYVSDVTIPDGTAIAAGTAFVKTWRLQNTGTCAWTTTYALSFLGGDQMSGVDAVLNSPVPPGGQSDVSVSLTAPGTAGTYTGQWQMRNALQQRFGSVITVVISVGAPGECKRSSRTQVTIAGHMNVENVIIDYGDGTVYTDSTGNYSFTVPMGWSGVVRPSKAKVNPWTFEPAQRTYSNLSCDLIRENYKAIPPPGV